MSSHQPTHVAHHIETDPETLPPPDGVNLSGVQLMLLMGATLLGAIIFLDIVSG